MFVTIRINSKQRWRDARDAAVALEDLEAENETQARQEAWKVCKDLASSDDILKEFTTALKGIGLVGEKPNGTIIFLALLSRLHSCSQFPQ